MAASYREKRRRMRKTGDSYWLTAKAFGRPCSLGRVRIAAPRVRWRFGLATVAARAQRVSRRGASRRWGSRRLVATSARCAAQTTPAAPILGETTVFYMSASPFKLHPMRCPTCSAA